jgi:dTDP-4-amino-4,6-dideoxygalactose transaminase
MFSFQAIKHITTGDGGLVSFKNLGLTELGKRLRWFGIDRTSKQLGIWENDIKEIGYKYQMTDIGAALGIAGLEDFTSILEIRQQLLRRYHENLATNSKVKILGKLASDRTHAAWLMTIAVENRRVLQKLLLDHGIESNQVHYRNDRYSIFGGRRENLPNMDMLEEKYLCLPLHTKMSIEDVDRVCEVINSGW